MLDTQHQKMQFFIWGSLLYFISLTSLLCGTSFDAYWHLKVGEWIVEHQQVPTSGIFSYTNASSPWVSHEWLSAVLMYAVFHYTGWGGMVFAALVCVFVSMMLLLRFTLKRLTAMQSLIFMLLAYLLLLSHIMPRPHILAIPVMIYWTASLIESCEKQVAPPWHLLAVMILWTNLHGSFIVGVAFAIFFAAESCYYASKDLRTGLAKDWALFIVAATFCTAITPHGIDGALMPLQFNNQSYAKSRIIEWASPNFHNFQPLEVWLLGFMALSLHQGIKLPVFRLVFLLGVIHLSLKHLRHSSDLLSVLPPLVLATPLGKHWNSKITLDFKDLLPKTYKGITFLSLFFILLFVYVTQVRTIESRSSLHIQEVLIALKDEKHRLGNLLNSYNVGGYLIFQGYETFIDTRAELYGDKFMEMFYEAIELKYGSENLETLLDKYEIGWTLFLSQDQINTYLATKPEWRRLYADKQITIFIKDSVALSQELRTKLKKLEQQAKDDSNAEKNVFLHSRQRNRRKAATMQNGE